MKKITRFASDCFCGLGIGRISCFWSLFVFLISMVAIAPESRAQDTPVTQRIIIDAISIDGNKKTKARLILRELEFQAGDTLDVQQLDALFERNRLRVLNLGLFNTAEISIVDKRTDGHVRLHIHVVEIWYIYPVPLFEIADRNFNVWWKEMHRSLKRVNYGMDCNHLNLSGNADLLKVKAQGGYSNKYELAYRRPNINRKQTLGLHNSISYSRQHEVALTTNRNKLDFRKDPNVWLIENWTAFSSLSWRPGLFNSHALTLEFKRNEVADTVAKVLNPDFFLNGATRQRHFSLIYNFTADYRDARPYPWKGWFFFSEFRGNGLLPGDDLKLSRFFLEYTRFILLKKKWSLEAGIKGRSSLPRRKPPYYNNQGLGYGGTFVRGYEYYVIDGLDFGMIKTGLHYRFLDRVFHLPGWMPKIARNFPLQLHLAFNNDLGYVNDPHYAARNPLSNTWLYGIGFGLDIVAYYNKTARLEYTRNHLGEWGFYLRANTGI